MNQRGFISSLYIYLIAGALILGLSYGLYKTTQKVGELNAKIEVQQAALAESESLRLAAEESIKARDDSIKVTRTEISRYRSKLKDLEAKYAEVLNTVLPELFIRSMCELTNSHSQVCVPTPNPDTRKAITGMGRPDGTGLDGVVTGGG